MMRPSDRKNKVNNTPGCGQQVGTKARKRRSLTLINSLRDENTNLPTQLYRDPPPSSLTIVGRAVATIVFGVYLVKWLDTQGTKGQT
jgi:hypothetical protein